MPITSSSFRHQEPQGSHRSDYKTCAMNLNNNHLGREQYDKLTQLPTVIVGYVFCRAGQVVTCNDLKGQNAFICSMPTWKAQCKVSFSGSMQQCMSLRQVWPDLNGLVAIAGEVLSDKTDDQSTPQAHSDTDKKVPVLDNSLWVRGENACEFSGQAIVCHDKHSLQPSKTTIAFCPHGHAYMHS